MGLSRQHTQEMSENFTNGLEPQQTITEGHLDWRDTNMPFTEEELTLALTKTTIKA